jgi:hypothetical protein
VRDPKPAAYRYVRAVSQVGREQLAEAIAALRTILIQRTIVRWMGIGISVVLVAVLSFALRNT